MSVKVIFKSYALFCVLIVVVNKFVTGSAANRRSFSYGPEKRYRLYQRSIEQTTECVTPSPINSTANLPEGTQNSASPSKNESTSMIDNSPSPSATKLFALVQHIYAAQARVQLEVNEIKRAQAVANSAQKSLEEATNNVRVITAALQSAQQEVATAAVRAQTAQMQLAAHDQLLFAARQKVDALSSQMVGLQAEDGVVMPKGTINVQALLAQLKEPLPQNQTPRPIPAVDKALNEGINSEESKELAEYDELDKDLFYR